MSVVRRSLYRVSRRDILLPSGQWIRWLPICGGWYACFIMGKSTWGCGHITSHAQPQLLRLSCLTVFGVSFFVAIATFKSFASFSPAKPTGLFVVYLIWPILCVAIYTLSQLVLVFRTLDDRWPLGDIIFGIAFYTIAQVLLFAFSVTICNAIKHYLDGLFFFTLCVLLSVMMVYKYWDSITVCRFAPVSVADANQVYPYSAKISSSRSDPRLPFGKSKIRF